MVSRPSLETLSEPSLIVLWKECDRAQTMTESTHWWRKVEVVHTVTNLTVNLEWS